MSTDFSGIGSCEQAFGMIVSSLRWLIPKRLVDESKPVQNDQSWIMFRSRFSLERACDIDYDCQRVLSDHMNDTNWEPGRGCVFDDVAARVKPATLAKLIELRDAAKMKWAMAVMMVDDFADVHVVTGIMMDELLQSMGEVLLNEQFSERRSHCIRHATRCEVCPLARPPILEAPCSAPQVSSGGGTGGTGGSSSSSQGPRPQASPTPRAAIRLWSAGNPCQDWGISTL
jgi:hypothetical protein